MTDGPVPAMGNKAAFRMIRAAITRSLDFPVMLDRPSGSLSGRY
jgi:hypothetical protein